MRPYRYLFGSRAASRAEAQSGDGEDSSARGMYGCVGADAAAETLSRVEAAVVFGEPAAAAALPQLAAQPQPNVMAAVPLTLDDLSSEERAEAAAAKTPLALAGRLHRKAVSLGRDTYIDPQSGYSVFTSTCLKRHECCGNGCRHCPYGHANVPRTPRRKWLEW